MGPPHTPLRKDSVPLDSLKLDLLDLDLEEHPAIQDRCSSRCLAIWQAPLPQQDLCTLLQQGPPPHTQPTICQIRTLDPNRTHLRVEARHMAIFMALTFLKNPFEWHS